MLIKKKGTVAELFIGTPLAGIKPGSKLTSDQSQYLSRTLVTLRRVVKKRRHFLLTHDSLQNTIGIFLQRLGYKVSYEVPFNIGGFYGDRRIFDIVAEGPKGTIVVEVKDEITSQDLGQVIGYIHALKGHYQDAIGVLLGTDILNYSKLVQGIIGSTVKELLDKEPFGVMLADKYILLICSNLARLTLEEMPEIVVSEGGLVNKCVNIRRQQVPPPF